MFSRLPVWAPSPVPDPMFREVPKAVERHEIAEIVAGYGTVAGHCAEGGFDGVELQCSHSSIVRGFLSPATNKRTDALRRHAAGPGPDPAGDRRRRARGDRARPRARRADLRRRADRGRQHAGRGGRGGQDDGGHRPGRLHQHLDRRGHRDAVHDRGVDGHPARLRAVHRQRHPAGGQAAGDRGGPDQGPDAGRAGAGRGALRPGRRGARPDRRPGLRRQGPRGVRHAHPHLPVLQPGMRRPDGPEPVAGLHRESRAPAGRPSLRRRAGRAGG